MGLCYWCLIGQIQKSVVLVVKTCQKKKTHNGAASPLVPTTATSLSCLFYLFYYFFGGVLSWNGKFSMLVPFWCRLLVFCCAVRPPKLSRCGGAHDVPSASCTGRCRGWSTLDSVCQPHGKAAFVKIQAGDEGGSLNVASPPSPGEEIPPQSDFFLLCHPLPPQPWFRRARRALCGTESRACHQSTMWCFRSEL